MMVGLPIIQLTLSTSSIRNFWHALDSVDFISGLVCKLARTQGRCTDYLMCIVAASARHIVSIGLTRGCRS